MILPIHERNLTSTSIKREMVTDISDRYKTIDRENFSISELLHEKRSSSSVSSASNGNLEEIIGVKREPLDDTGCSFMSI